MGRAVELAIMFSSEQIAALFKTLGVTHVVTVPDSTIGQWESAIEQSGIALVRVCREGEAWSVRRRLFPRRRVATGNDSVH